MDRWTDRMETVEHFCDPCQSREAGSAVGCAWLTAVTFSDGAAAVASYLRSRMDSYAAPSRPHIDETARRYERIVDLLRPTLHGNAGDQYRQILGDMAEQRKHAATLREARDELTAAASAMQLAVESATSAW